MLFILPPSETKVQGGTGLTLAQLGLTFGALNDARQQVAKRLDVGLDEAPTMPAIERYSGTLYSAIHGRGLKGSPTALNQLSAAELAKAKEMVLIQSALFGLISSTDRIPNYKLSPTKKLGDLSLKNLWTASHESVWPRLMSKPIIDLRSKAYAELAPIPEGVEHYSVSVFLERPGGEREQLNHFNKKAKGQLVRSALVAANAPQSIADLQECAANFGLKLEVSERALTLVI